LKYVILGAAGQLGRDLTPRLPGEVVALTRQHIDVTQAGELRRVLGELEPDTVLNCTAYNFVDRAESERDAAFAVNAWALGELATICRDLDCTLVTFSTDYVFGLDESRRAPYRETDPPGPVSAYGLSKLSGEYVARASCPRHLVIRTCGLYGVWGSGGKGGNFVETMLRLAAEGKPLRVVDDQVCTPSYTADIAEASIALLTCQRYGLYHITNAGSCTWCAFARGILEAAGINAQVTPITSAEYGAVARRPAYSVLARSAYEALGLPPVRAWQEAIRAYMAERQRIRR
jgi:dTDP-4-dehydrorhamnose reductase